MYDFCFTPIYAILLAIGGVIGFIAKGSAASLGAGVGAALLLSLLTYVSFSYFKKSQRCKLAVFASLVMSTSIAVFMYQKFSDGYKLHHAIGGFVSGMMSAYYIWNLTLFRPSFGGHKKA